LSLRVAPIGIRWPSRKIKIKELPVLGSGKLDLKGVKQAAMERFAPKEETDETRS
jgi:hypothetical protein